MKELSLFEHKKSIFDYKFGCKSINISGKKLICLTRFIRFNLRFRIRQFIKIA